MVKRGREEKREGARDEEEVGREKNTGAWAILLHNSQRARLLSLALSFSFLSILEDGLGGDGDWLSLSLSFLICAEDSAIFPTTGALHPCRRRGPHSFGQPARLVFSLMAFLAILLSPRPVSRSQHPTSNSNQNHQGGVEDAPANTWVFICLSRVLV